MKGTLKISANTPLKKWPWDTKTLYDHGLLFDEDWKKEGETFRIDDSYLWDGVKDSEADDHVVVLLEDGDRRYVYAQHCQLELDEDPDNKPEEEVTKTGKTVSVGPVKLFNRGKLIRVPGISHKVGTNDPIFYGAHFTWGEATKGGTRIPVNTRVSYKIVEMAHAMEEIRSYLGGRPIRVNSYYRDPATNRRVGGARRSQHLTGGAVDFVVKGMSPSEVYEKLDPWWGSRGGLASSSVFTHVDIRGGVRARWSYGF